ncbi:MAG: NADPH-dependent 7-cyano-7-deazaguanine reductase QueF [Pseudomonadales bacterium]
MSDFAGNSPLGKTIHGSDVYAPELLFPIARSEARAEFLDPDSALPFTGIDLWTAFELSWLNASGKPEAGVAEFELPFDSPSLVESKSIKLYLNSFNFTRIASKDELTQILASDLSQAAGAPVKVRIYALQEYAALGVASLPGPCLDDLDIAVDSFEVDSGLLSAAGEEIHEQVYTNLFRSCCPVTGQPDWASVYVDYRGPAIDHKKLLAYLLSFRQHEGFHEQCVERIFVDIQQHCKPLDLTVYARFMRRGGLDINPWRSSGAAHCGHWRLERQ